MEDPYQRLVKQDVVDVTPLVLLRSLDQIEYTEIVKVSILLSICYCKVALRLAGLVDDLIHKFWRILKGQLPHLLQNALAQGRLLLHEVNVVVHPAHHKLISNLHGQDSMCLWKCKHDDDKDYDLA